MKIILLVIVSFFFVVIFDAMVSRREREIKRHRSIAQKYRYRHDDANDQT